MSTIVCGKNWWPFTGFDTCNLPATLIAGTEAFNAFYNKKHRGRKLTFRSDLGSVEVKVRFTARVHELTVSTHAMVVLSQFEGLRPNETLSYQVRLLVLSSCTLFVDIALLVDRKSRKLPQFKKENYVELFSHSLALNTKFFSSIQKVEMSTTATPSLSILASFALWPRSRFKL